MNPKNYKDFYEDIAKEAEVHKDLVSDFISFFYSKVRYKSQSFYSKVRYNLSTLSNPKINLPGLGTFKIRKGKLKNAIKRNKDILGNIEKRTYKGYAKHLPVINKLKEMEDMMNKVNQNIKEKKEFKNENK